VYDSPWNHGDEGFGPPPARHGAAHKTEIQASSSWEEANKNLYKGTPPFRDGTVGSIQNGVPLTVAHWPCSEGGNCSAYSVCSRQARITATTRIWDWDNGGVLGIGRMQVGTITGSKAGRSGLVGPTWAEGGTPGRRSRPSIEGLRRPAVSSGRGGRGGEDTGRSIREKPVHGRPQDPEIQNSAPGAGGMALERTSRGRGSTRGDRGGGRISLRPNEGDPI